MRALVACCALLVAAGPALAQGQLRMLPVPADAAVVVPPRGAAAPPRLVPSPEAWQRLRSQPPPAPPAALAGAAPLAPRAPLAGLLLPLAAGALLGAAVPGSGGGGAGVAPAVTAAPP
jgi:hypothetical protein